MSQQKARYYEFGEFRLDARKRVLLRNGELVHLTLKIFQLLLVLVERSGQVMEKDDLMEMVWPDAIVEEANLKNSISTLRKTLGDERGAETYIQTLPKRGYRFVAPVTLWPDADEIYLVEKRTTAEIVIDEVQAEEKPIDEARAQITAYVKSSLPAGGEELVEASRSNIIAVEESNPAEGNISSPARNRKATVAVLLIAAIGLSIGLYIWIKAGRAKSAFSFDRMKMTLLPNVGRDGAIISPDGKYLAYVVSGTSTDGMWIRQTATDSAIRLLPEVNLRGFTFSRDSDYVYCLFLDDKRPEGELYRVPVLGGSAKLVVERIGGEPSFSPDGRRLVFKRGVRKPSLLTANTDGSDERIILPSNSRYTIWRYAWSPDGKTIVLVVRNDAVEKQVTWQVIEIPCDGGEERAVTQPQEGFIAHITWLPDASGLVMTLADKTGEQQLWHLSYPSGITTQITNDSSKYTETTITADGETILAKRITTTQSLWIGEAADLNEARKITSDDEHYDYLSWTPDGRILHSDGDSDKSDLWIMNSDGSGRERLTTDQRRNCWPSMSPDGRYIVFASSRSGSQQIWRIDSDGRNAKQLTDWHRGCERAEITPDGRWVVYGAWVPPRMVLKKVPIDGGESVMLAEKTRSFAISPDGKLLAFVSIDEEKKRRVIIVTPMDGGEPTRILDTEVYSIEQWTKDGLLCISSDRTEIIQLPLDGRPAKEYFKSADRIFSFALAPDGRRLVFSRGSFGLETVRIANIKEK